MNKITGPALLLCPQIPKPMHGVNPRSIKGQRWWDVERWKAYQAANYRCEACGVHKLDALFHKWLEAHEWYDIDYAKGRLTFKYLVALCHACHNYIHQGRLQQLLRQDEISELKYNTIIAHGDRILRTAKLCPSQKDAYDGPIADWKDWRLEFDGKLHTPKHANYAEWRKFYGYEPLRMSRFDPDQAEADDYEGFGAPVDQYYE